MGAAAYAISSTYLMGCAKGARELGLLDALWNRLSPASQNAFSRPQARLWWDPTELEAFGELVLKEYGPQMVEDLGHKIMVLAVSKITSSFIRVTVALEGEGVTPLMRHMGELSEASVKGVPVSYTELGPKRGLLRVQYPHEAPASNGYFWQGGIRGVLKTSKAPNARVVEMRQAGGTFEFDIAWD